MGRKPILSYEEQSKAMELWTSGELTQKEAAKRCGVCVRTFQNYASAWGATVQKKPGVRREDLPEIYNQNITIDPSCGCHLWTGYVNNKGYPMMFFTDEDKKLRGILVHRYSFEQSNGPIPPGMLVCHECDVPLCSNPDHLWLGTHADNMADMSRKGRARGGRPRVNAGCIADLPADHVIRLYQEGIQSTAIGKEYRVSAKTICDLLAKHGVPRRPRGRPPKIRIAA